jgi:AAA+ superfamily predicted ATPase
MNLTVNVLLRELESFNGIVIFATNLAANFDPAFERRIRTHVLFEMPGPEERTQIWRLQVHPDKTPLAANVDFKKLAERYVASGGDIKNAVLKAATAAAATPGPDIGKKISQQHFEAAMEQVIAARQIMRQSVFNDSLPIAPETVGPGTAWQDLESRWRTAIIVSLSIAGAAFLISLVAIVMAFLR